MVNRATCSGSEWMAPKTHAILTASCTRFRNYLAWQSTTIPVSLLDFSRSSTLLLPTSVALMFVWTIRGSCLPLRERKPLSGKCFLVRLRACPIARNTTDAAEQIVGRERRERVSQLAWCGAGGFDSRRRVNSTVMWLFLILT